MQDEQFKKWAFKMYGLTEWSDMKQWVEAYKHYGLQNKLSSAWLGKEN